MIDEVKYLVISDIHLGHKTSYTKDIIDNLDEFILNAIKSYKLDILFLAGDVFDSLLTFPSNEATEITIWMGNLIKLCSQYKIKLRVLEGTPSHDWHQSKKFEILASYLSIEIDLKYITDIHIEYINDLDLYVLYVPDEARSTANETYRVVKTLLKNLNINKVDIAIMHGEFKYQLPHIPYNDSKHIESDYLNIVRHFINIGHIHNFTKYDRIIAQGSFDRLIHGEENPKGGTIQIIRDKGIDEFYFIENTKAKIYNTILLNYNDYEKSIIYIRNKLKGLKYNSRIRIKANKNHPVFLAFNELKKRFPFYVFSKKNIEDDVIQNTENKINVNNNITYTPITINKDNIKNLLLESLENKISFNNKQLEFFEQLFE